MKVRTPITTHVDSGTVVSSGVTPAACSFPATGFVHFTDPEAPVFTATASIASNDPAIFRALALQAAMVAEALEAAKLQPPAPLKLVEPVAPAPSKMGDLA